jgi:hypothetical protein
MTSRISTPRHYSVTNALKATGQDKIADPDPGSPAQRLHDQRFGVSYIGDRVALPVEIAAVVVPEATGEAPDRAVVTDHLDQVGMDYKPTIEAAQAVLDRAGSPVKADERQSVG